ncbi:MAG: T9SS type A sorting domain-containing protein [bacterium]|nr:T9SS type A sorting domain-containing protein [bacterium]
MKKVLLSLTIFLTLAGFINAQDNRVNDSKPSVLRAPEVTGQSITPNNPPVTAYNSRFFAQSVAATSQIIKSFLNTPSVFTNVGPSVARNLFGGAQNGAGVYFGLEYIGAGVGNLVRIDTTTGVITTIAPLTGMSAGHTLTGMAWDKTSSTMYVVTTNGSAGTLYTINLTTGALTTVAAVMAGTTLPIDISISNTGIMYSCDIGTDVLNTINKTTGAATLVGPLGINLNFAQGMAIDPGTDSLFLGAYLATNTSGLYRCNTSTGATTLIGGLGPTGTAEVDAMIIPGVSGPPPPTGNTLVLLHDSTLTDVAKRKADRDTLNRYLGLYIRNYTLKATDSSTNLGDLSTYNTIIIQETSFDNGNVRYLGATARNQIMSWLQTGTASSKKSLIMIGADIAYNYSRTGSAGRDLIWSETYGKFIYRVDNGSPSPSSVTGTAIDIGNVRNIVSPVDAGYYPDGCSIVPGGSAGLYKYPNHTAADTVAAIGNVQANYVVATVFQDPRYFTGGFKNVLAAVIGYVVTNGGVITGLNNNTIATIADSYSLSQNYPNPFNPSTKISYALPKAGFVTLKIYDILGKEVTTLVNEFKNAGAFEINFDGSNFSSGTYFYRLESDGFVQTRKMSLLK